MENPKLVYIMGRGHSGSTMLDAILGNSRQIESVGELISGFSRLEREACSCGTKVTECFFWKRVLEQYNRLNSPLPIEVFGRESIKQANVKNFLSTFLSRKKYNDLAESNVALFKAISSVADKPIVVDSNKEPSRATLLLRNYGNAYVIHLVRRPENVVSSSYYRMIKGDKLQFLRMRFHPKGIARPVIIMLIAVSWSLGNILAEVVKLVYGKRVITIRYEDFIECPSRQVRRVGRFLNISLDELALRLENDELFEVGHNIGGNRFRFEKEFKIRKSGTERPIPKYLSLFTKIINFPMMLYYRYSLSAKK